jgi:hypothetical protein
MSQRQEVLDVIGIPVRPTTAAHVYGLVLPADDLRPSAVIAVPDTAAGFSDAIGGGLLDEIHHGVHAGRAYTVYADEQHATKGLPLNVRAGRLAEHLGWKASTDVGMPCGDLLVVGAQAPGRDTDVSLSILQAAAHAGILPPPGDLNREP